MAFLEVSKHSFLLLDGCMQILSGFGVLFHSFSFFFFFECVCAFLK